MNLYAFVHNDPLTHFDEYGLIMAGNDLKSLQSMGFYHPDPAYSQYVSKVGMYFASKLTHEVYDYSGLGLIRNDRSKKWQRVRHTGRIGRTIAH